MQNNIQKSILIAAAASEISHIFCCVLPTLFSVVGLFAGLGFVVTMPPMLENIHDMLHDYEPQMIAVSAFIMLVGWILHFAGKSVDCHNTGCVHEPCGPKKTRAHKVLIFATLLFACNLVIYFAFHAPHTH